ncbi:MAG TPA: DinB family protein [Fimbriimonas sp.]
MLSDATPLAGYPEPYATLCAVLQDGTREWRGELDPEISDEAVAWQPHPSAPSIAHLMLHIIGVELAWFEGTVQKKEWNREEVELVMLQEIDVDQDKWPPLPLRPFSWYLDLHDHFRARILEGIKSWPSADAAIEDGEESVTPRWVLGHVIQHEAYHGGQIVLLNRLWHLLNRA